MQAGRLSDVIYAPLSATAKNGWEGGGRRGVKLAIGMGSHWLDISLHTVTDQRPLLDRIYLIHIIHSIT